MLRKIYRQYIASFQGLSRQVWLLALLMLINRSGTMVIPFLSVYLTQQLGFSLQQTGWVMGFFGLGSLVGVYIGGYLTDKIGYYRVQLGSLLLTGAMFFVLQKVDSFFLFNALIFVTSAITDAFRPANMTAVSEYSEVKDQTRSISLIRLAINAGWAVGPAIGGVAAIKLGYHWLFWLDGLTCILAGLFLYFFLSPPQNQVQEEQPLDPISTSRPILKDRVFMVFIVLNSLTMLVFFQLFTSIPVYFKANLGLQEDQIGLIMALNGLIIALVEMPMVYLLVNRVPSLRVITIGTLLITIAFLAFNLGYWPGLAVVCMVFLTFGEIFHMPFANGYTMSRANKKNMGKYLSYYGMSFSVAFILAPVIGMQIADLFGYRILWNVLGVIGLISALGYVVLYRKTAHT